jgi:hypothetical protein
MSAYGGIPELAVETNERKPRSIPKIVVGVAAAVLVAVGIVAIVQGSSGSSGSSADTTATSTDSTTELYTAAGFKVTTYYKCINPTCTDSWCDANCNHRPVYCPASFCKKVTVDTPVPAPPPAPTTGCVEYGNGYCASGFLTGGPRDAGQKTLETCEAECLADSTCAYFSFEPTSAICSLYSDADCTTRYCGKGVAANNCGSDTSYVTYKCGKTVVTPAPTPAATPAPPTPAPPSSACPNNGILGTSWFNTAGVQENSAVALICCPAECGNCAGAGCGKETGGPKDCCAQDVMPQQKKCSDSAPPCILEDAPAGN